MTTGKTMTEFQDEQEEGVLLYDVALIGLTMDRDQLYERINKRVDIMLSEGLIEEVESLHSKGIRDVQSIQAIGYKEIYEYLEGVVSYDDAIENLKRNSRRYAKRQLTWFRNKMDVCWFDMTQVDYEKKLTEIIHSIAGKLTI
jgi:tRNA dimethylallyltransferase